MTGANDATAKLAAEFGAGVAVAIVAGATAMLDAIKGPGAYEQATAADRARWNWLAQLALNPNGLKTTVIRKFLDCCTSNLTEETCTRLWAGDLRGTILRDISVISGQPDPAAVFIYVPAESDPPGIDVGWPPDLIVVVNYARSQGCDYICFDRDAEPCQAIPIYEWEPLEFDNGAVES